MQIDRRTTKHTLSLTTSLGTTEACPMTSLASGMVFIPTGSSITSLTFHAAHTAGGTYHAVYDSAGTAVTKTVAATRCYPLPVSIYGCHSFKIVSDAAGDVTVMLIG